MPQTPEHPCNAPGCPETTSKRFCPEHETAENQRRGSAASRGYGANHRRWRTMVLHRSPLCAECLKRKKTVAASVADHIIPLGPRGGTWSLENGQGLCKACHSKKTASER